MKPDTTIHTIQLRNCIVVIKNVPCLKCSQCGETVFSTDTIEKVEQILRELQSERSNVVLIGMPGSGKTIVAIFLILLGESQFKESILFMVKQVSGLW